MKNHHVGASAAGTMASRNIRRTLLSSAVLGALSTMAAHAQDAAPAPAVRPPAVEQLDTVIVTGTARSQGLKKLDASFSITNVGEEQIKDAAPASTADLLKIVPGVMVETTGGATGANIEVRGFPSAGDAPFVTMQLNGSALFPPPTLSFLENSSLFRLDDTIDRVEVLRGGPSPIFSNGQPGATVNFIQKKGTDAAEGSVRLTSGTGNLLRMDGVYSGRIAPGWYGSLGGFYRTSSGVRDTQFPADRGGQFSAMLTRKLEEGELSVYGRWLNDKNAFHTGIPLISTNNGRTLSSFPGFPAQTATLLGNDLRQVEFEATPGATPGTIKRDLADGRGAEVKLYGLSLDKKLGGWTLSEKANYLSASMPTYALFTGANPQTLGSYISDQVSAANGNAAVLAAAGGTAATGGSASFVNGGAITDMSQQVIVAGAWSVDKQVQSFTNDLRISRDLSETNTLTLGTYFADYSSKDVWYLGNNMLMSVEPNARKIDLTLNNGARVTSKGFAGGPFFALNGDYNGQNAAVFVADEWKVSQALRLDGGVRYERQRVNATVSNASSVDLDANPLTLYNNNVSVVNGTSRSIVQTDHATSYTAGANLYLAKDLSVFGRINSGFTFPQFDNLRDGQTNLVKIKQYEIGLKTQNKLYSAYLTGYVNDFKGLQYQQFLLDGTNITSIGGSQGKGLEAEASVRPLPGLELALSGNYIDAKYKNFGANSGNRVQRQPKLQFRFTPSYRFDTELGSVRVYATYAQIGERFADVQNQQVLPKYHTIDAGAVAHLNNGIDLRVSGTNLGNTIGITEGNSRVAGSATGAGGVFLGRPIFGRAVEVSAGFNF